MKNFFRKVAFGLKPEEKAPSDPLTWAQKQVETIPELNWKGKHIYSEKEMKAPGPAKDYKNQDLKVKSSSNWGWLYAYATRFPNHENIKRIQEWANNPDNLNKYQIGFVYHYKNIGKNNFNDASWTVVEANCHFLK